MANVARLLALGFFIITSLLTVDAAGAGQRSADPAGPERGKGTYDESALKRIDFSTLPAPTVFPARDGTPLAVRVYPSEAETVIVAVHGSSGSGRYYLPIARYLSEHRTATVYAVDLRGHGLSGGRRGDVDYVGQLEDDVADILTIVRSRHPAARIVMMGHSAGGGLAVRYAAAERKPVVDGYILLAPFLGAWAPTTKPASGGWAIPDMPKIVRLMAQSAIGITRGQDDVTLRFNMSDAQRARGNVGAYTFRMMTSLNPRSLRGRDLAGIHRPLLVLVGDQDESFYADQYEPLVRTYTAGTVHVLPHINHLEIVVHPRTAQEVEAWLNAQR